MEAIEKILDKLGIYDLIVILLTGIIITTFSALIVGYFYADSISSTLVALTDNSLILFAASYIAGVLFQEVSSLIQKNITHPNDQILRAVLFEEEQKPQMLTAREKSKIIENANKALENEKKEEKGKKDISASDIYNWCKFQNINNSSIVARTDRDQATAGLSRSLALYFFSIAILCLFIENTKKDTSLFPVCCISLLFGCILQYRAVRFAKLRYVFIFRQYLYMSEKKL